MVGLGRVMVIREIRGEGSPKLVGPPYSAGSPRFCCPLVRAFKYCSKSDLLRKAVAGLPLARKESIKLGTVVVSRIPSSLTASRECHTTDLIASFSLFALLSFFC